MAPVNAPLVIAELRPPVGAVVPSPGQRVNGVLLNEVDETNLRLLDAFENVAAGLYDRVSCQVSLTDGEVVSAQLYVGGELVRHHLGEEWNETAFREQWYSQYRERIIPGFVQDYHRQTDSC